MDEEKREGKQDATLEAEGRVKVTLAPKQIVTLLIEPK